MARRRNQKKKNDDTLVDIVEVKDNAQSFFEKNQTTVLGALTLLLFVVGGFFAYKTFVKEPKERTAMEAMSQAQLQFERDSFALALQNANGTYEGFLEIIDNYSGSKAANLANYYAGICYMRLGQFDGAISFLKDFSAGGDVLPITKYGAIGDCQGELGKFDEAISSYKKAVSSSDNEFLSAYYLKKLGLLYEKQGNTASALDAFSQIKSKYPLSTEGRDIEKYIARSESAQ